MKIIVLDQNGNRLRHTANELGEPEPMEFDVPEGTEIVAVDTADDIGEAIVLQVVLDEKAPTCRLCGAPWDVDRNGCSNEGCEDHEVDPLDETDMKDCQTCGRRLDPEKGEVFLTDDGGVFCADHFDER